MQNTSAFTKTILIVDDDPGWARVAAQIFQTADFSTHIAANSTAAISYLQSTMPDCVVLDFYLPDQNGSSVADYIRSNEKLQKTPLVIVSGDETLAKSAHYACKADSFMVKTTDMFNILYTVEKILRRIDWDLEIQRYEDIKLDGKNLSVQRKTGKLIKLSSEHFSLLALLVGKSPDFVKDHAIAKSIFNIDDNEDKSNAIRSLAHRLRKKLGTQLRQRIKYQDKAGWAYVLPEKILRKQNSSHKNTPQL